MKERNKAVPAVYILLEKEGKILLGLRQNTGYYDGAYQFPAGHIEAGELPTVAMAREAIEEVGIQVRPEDLELIHVGYRSKHDETGDRIDLYFRAKAWIGEPRNMEPEKCGDLNWFPWDQLPENIVFHVHEAIKAIRHGVHLKEITVEELKAKGLYKL